LLALGLRLLGVRQAVFLRFGGRLLGHRLLRFLAQPAEQAFLFAGLGRCLLVVVGTKHGEGILKDAIRRQPRCRPNGLYPSTSQSGCAKHGFRHQGRFGCGYPGFA